MSKTKPDETYYTKKELELNLLKEIRIHTRNELFKMASLVAELSKSEELPLEWRKKHDDKLLKFIIKNKNLKLSVIYKKLK